ncbi:MAG: PD-(D/E)XK nuclease domain-containing protein [Treponema sp.]|nr:PD-(D/E)XK nuclease domain-containing protein [Treponema sp.]
MFRGDAGEAVESLVETGDYVYCFEFKAGGEGKVVSVEEALRLLDGWDYLLPWRWVGVGGKRRGKAGVVFDVEKRNIGEWKAEEAGKGGG